MSDKKVIVLLSAYNGEAHIAEQIDSILNQTYKNIELYVRDDGSKDNTLEILRNYEREGLIRLEAGQNVGFVKSFLWLIENSGDADFYSFSDQDDVWNQDKIELAVKALEHEDEDIPILYFTNYDYYDGNMNFMGHRDLPTPKTCFRNSLVDCVPLGFNTVFNKKAHDLTVQNMPVRTTGHDWWMYMLCAGLGKVIYDDTPTVKYRRHNNNVSDAGDSFIKFQIWRFKRFFVNDYFSKIHDQIKEYGELFENQLSPEDVKILKMFALDGFHPINTLKKVFYPKYYRQRIIDEIFLRFVILIGRL